MNETLALSGQAAIRSSGQAWVPRVTLGAPGKVSSVEIHFRGLVDWKAVQQALVVFEQALEEERDA